MPTVLTGIRTPSSGAHSSPVYSQDCLLDSSGTLLKNTVSGPHATSVRLEGGQGPGNLYFKKAHHQAALVHGKDRKPLRAVVALTTSEDFFENIV